MVFTNNAYSSDMGTPLEWFAILMSVAFMYSALLYIVCALVFIPFIRKGKIEKDAAYGLPTVIVIIGFIIVAFAGFWFFTAGAAVGCILSTVIYFAVLKKYAVYSEK